MTRHYVISDLHLGMGRGASGTWHPLEDFKSDTSFKKFLDSLEREGVDELIINGDWIDFTQLEPLAYTPGLYSADGHRLGWTEADSLQKLESCRGANAHQGFFDDLRAFLNTGRKVTVVMGNHDPDLFWPRMQEEVRSLLGSPPRDQFEMVMTSVRRGTAHVEHGHQHCSPENKFYLPSNVFHECAADGLTRLELVWGSVFVMEFFNTVEERLPFADNIKTQINALWLGIKNGWVDGRTAALFVKFLWGAGVPWGTIIANVLSVEARGEEESIQLIRNLDDQELARELMAVYDDDSKFKAEFDEEISRTEEAERQAINSLKAVDGGEREAQQQPVTLEELTPDDEARGTAVMGIFRENPELRGAAALLSSGAEYVVFGHTHAEIDGAVSGAEVPNYFNTGSWVNSMDLSTEENRARLRTITEDDLRDDTLFELRLRAALIEVGDEGRRTNVSLTQIEV